MTAHNNTPRAPDALDALLAQLLDLGGVLSQMISSMHEFEASGLGSPDAPPVLEVAHSLIRSVLGGISEQHSEAEFRVSAKIVEHITAAICDEIYIVPTDEIRRMRGGPSPTSRHRRQRSRSRRRRR